MNKQLLILSTLFVVVYCHIPAIEKAALRTRFSDNRWFDKFSFERPYDLDVQAKTANNSFTDARAVHMYMEANEAKVIKFTVKEGEVGIANTVPWTPACEQSERI